MLALDGSRLEADFIPRLESDSLEDVEVVGRPTRMLFDVVHGAVYEIQLRGSLGEFRFRSVPAPAVTNPFRSFFDWVKQRR